MKTKPIPGTGYKSDVAALGGWGGEMMINAHKHTFIGRTSANFPTMGYMFNAALWKDLSRHKRQFFEMETGHADWAMRIGTLYRDGQMKGSGRPCPGGYELSPLPL